MRPEPDELGEEVLDLQSKLRLGKTDEGRRVGLASMPDGQLVDMGMVREALGTLYAA